MLPDGARQMPEARPNHRRLLGQGPGLVQEFNEKLRSIEADL